MVDRSGKLHIYSGVATQAILDSAGVTTGRQLRGENLSKYVLIKCADGYEVVFRLPRGFTDRKAIITDAVEGTPLPVAKGPFRMVPRGEKKPARNCFPGNGYNYKVCKGVAAAAFLFLAGIWRASLVESFNKLFEKYNAICGLL